MTSYSPTYATITSKEWNLLAKNKAPRSVWAVLVVLNSFAQDTCSCFPSVATIERCLENSISQSTIGKALKWLCDYKIIKRNHRQSKQRFINLVRRMVYGGSEKPPPPADEKVTRQTSVSATRQTSVIEENQRTEPSNPSLSPQFGEQANRPKKKKGRTITQRIQKAEKRLQGLRNLWNNREHLHVPERPLLDDCRALINNSLTVLSFGGSISFSNEEEYMIRQGMEKHSDLKEFIHGHDQLSNALNLSPSMRPTL